MFDWIEIPNIVCPNCSREINACLQTKSGTNSLTHYQIGDKFYLNDLEMRHNKKSKQVKTINAIGSCEYCGIGMNGWVTIDYKDRIIKVEIYRFFKNLDKTIVFKKRIKINRELKQ